MREAAAGCAGASRQILLVVRNLLSFIQFCNLILSTIINRLSWPYQSTSSHSSLLVLTSLIRSYYGIPKQSFFGFLASFIRLFRFFPTKVIKGVLNFEFLIKIIFIRFSHFFRKINELKEVSNRDFETK